MDWDSSENDSVALNKKGWFLLTYYQTKNNPLESRAHELAKQKVAKSTHNAAIRICKKGEYTVFEVWEHW